MACDGFFRCLWALTATSICVDSEALQRPLEAHSNRTRSHIQGLPCPSMIQAARVTASPRASHLWQTQPLPSRLTPIGPRRSCCPRVSRPQDGQGARLPRRTSRSPNDLPTTSTPCSWTCLIQLSDKPAPPGLDTSFPGRSHALRWSAPGARTIHEHPRPRFSVGSKHSKRSLNLGYDVEPFATPKSRTATGTGRRSYAVFRFLCTAIRLPLGADSG